MFRLVAIGLVLLAVSCGNDDDEECGPDEILVEDVCLADLAAF